MTVAQFLTEDHRACDEDLVKAENEYSKGDLKAGAESFRKFRDSVLHHFRMEEEILFPELEKVMGSGMGPIAVMKMEHNQMRMFLDQLDKASASEDKKAFLQGAESLLYFIQQHNGKEEQIVYQMANQILGPGSEEMVARLKAMV